MKYNRAAATHAVFPTTCWTAVISLKNAGSDKSIDTAMSSLCETYWYPLYAFARHKGRSSHDAEDAVQGFFVSIASVIYFQKADHNTGKMRTFLLTGFTRYMKDVYKHDNAKKRGGDVQSVSLDTDQAEEWLTADPNSGEDSAVLDFEKNWARSTMRLAIELLGKEAEGSAKAEARFKVLSRFLNPESCHDFTRQEAAEELGITADSCDKAIQRLRQSFRLNVKELVASTLEDPSEENIMEEMIQLQKALTSV